MGMSVPMRFGSETTIQRREAGPVCV